MAEGTAELVRGRDYSGVPTAELVTIFEQYLKDTGESFDSFARRVPMDEQDLKKTLVSQNYAFTGLATADKILLHGMGFNISQMAANGEIHVVPARSSRKAARYMVEDRCYAFDLDFDEDEIVAEIDELLEARERYVVPTEAQKERLRKDVRRATARKNQS